MCTQLLVYDAIQIRVSLFVIGFVILFLCWPILFGCHLATSTNAIDCLERLVPEMTYYVLNTTHYSLL